MPGSEYSTGPGAETTPFLNPSGHRPLAMRWPGVQYPWMPWIPGWSGFAKPVDRPGRICLGNQCWPYARLTLANAEEIVAVLRKRSWPIASASVAAIALYENGFRRQSRAVVDVYGGIYGLDRLQAQIDAIYYGGGPTEPTFATIKGPPPPPG